MSIDQKNLVKALKALANENRLKILEAIQNYGLEPARSFEDIRVLDPQQDGGCCVDEITNWLSMAQSSASQHLKEMYNAGLLLRHKKAQWVYYSVDSDMMEQVVDYLEQFSPPKRPEWVFRGIGSETLERAMEYLYLNDSSRAYDECA